MPISKIETDSLASGLVAPTATALTTASGSAPSYSARAWVNFNGTGTVAIRASGNVSSITDSGVGSYVVNFLTAMPDANYSAVLTTCRENNESDFRGADIDLNAGYATTSFRIATIVSGTTLTDRSMVTASIFR